MNSEQIGKTSRLLHPPETELLKVFSVPRLDLEDVVELRLRQQLHIGYLNPCRRRGTSCAATAVAGARRGPRLHRVSLEGAVDRALCHPSQDLILATNSRASKVDSTLVEVGLDGAVMLTTPAPVPPQVPRCPISLGT